MANPKKKDCKRVLAKWSCSSDGCPNKWTGSTLILIKKYKDKISAKDLKIGDYIEQKCKICDNKQNELTDYEPYFFEHLVYEDKEKKKWYRVFGEWDCNNNECEKKWTSSYTWILLEKYQNDIPASDLNRGDYFMQDCKECNNGDNKLVNYRHLIRSRIKFKKPHLSLLCEKCRNHTLKCQQHVGI
ncbi:4260_t:CDS:1 [Funneliformis geosporum]|nr:4260_t:CDS:1 [Funneliformis geosporum]